MNRQQRSAHYFDLLWEKIISNYRKKSEIDNFINDEKDEITIETISRLGHYAYGDRHDDNDLLLASIMQNRIAELQREKTEKLEVRKANYFSILIKAISKVLNQDMITTGMVFLFEDSHTSIKVYEFELLASFAYKEHSEVCYQLFAILLKERFFELIKKSLVPQPSPAETFPRYRDKDQQIHVDKFLKGSPQNHFLRSSIQTIFEDGGMSIDTANKLLNAGLKKGIDLYNAHPDWLMILIGKEDLDMMQKTFNSCSLEQGEAKIARYREELKDFKIYSFPKDTRQSSFLRASIVSLVNDGAFNSVTVQKLTDLKITSGFELFKTNPQWLMGYLDEEELGQIDNLFLAAGLNYVPTIFTDAQNDFLSKPIEELQLSVRMLSNIKAYNTGKPTEEQYRTAGDIYRTDKKTFLFQEMRHIGKKQLDELPTLFSDHKLIWR